MRYAAPFHVRNLVLVPSNQPHVHFLYDPLGQFAVVHTGSRELRLGSSGGGGYRGPWVKGGNALNHVVTADADADADADEGETH